MKKILLLKQEKQYAAKLKLILAAGVGCLVGGISFPIVNGIITVSATITAAIISLGIGVLTYETILKKCFN
ncbi:MAG: hypothetical protein ACRCX8_06910 [Sarcina sp.]